MSGQTAIEGLEDAQGRHPDDFYITPAWVTRAIVPYLGCPKTVLDIGCGAGAIGKVLREAWWDARIAGVECHERRREAAQSSRHMRGDEARMTYTSGAWNRDWMSWRGLRGETFEEDFGAPPDLMISNPPFRHALPFLRLALERVAAGGTVAFLLPGQWDQETEAQKGRERLNFLDSLRLTDGREGYGKYAIEGRIDFRGNGSTDRICYAWFVFGPGHEGVHRRIPALPKATAEQGKLPL